MKHLILSLAAAAAAAAAAGAARAQSAGRVLLLADGRLVEGDIVRDGDAYRVRRGVNVIDIPAAGARHLAASRRGVYLFLRRGTPDTAAGHVHLARWCLGHGLRDDAHREASAALRMRPDDRRLRGMVDSLRPRRAAGPQRGRPAEPARLPGVELPTGVDPEAHALFFRRVQPTLSNLCAKCHAAGRSGGFVLSPGNGRDASLANLAASLNQIDLNNLAESRLLKYSLTPHGGSKTPPIGGSGRPPYKWLTAWAVRAAGARPGADLSGVPPPPGDPANAVARAAWHLKADRELKKDLPPPPAGSTPKKKSDEPDFLTPGQQLFDPTKFAERLKAAVKKKKR